MYRISNSVREVIDLHGVSSVRRNVGGQNGQNVQLGLGDTLKK